MADCWKDTYKTLKKAIQAANSATRKYKQKFHAYQCDKCGLYHLTKFSRKQHEEFHKKGRRPYD